MPEPMSRTRLVGQGQRGAGVTDGVGAVIVPLVEGEELGGRDCIVRPDAPRRQAAGDPVDVGVERHGSQVGRIAHFFSWTQSNML